MINKLALPDLKKHCKEMSDGKVSARTFSDIISLTEYDEPDFVRKTVDSTVQFSNMDSTTAVPAKMSSIKPSPIMDDAYGDSIPSPQPRKLNFTDDSSSASKPNETVVIAPDGSTQAEIARLQEKLSAVLDDEVESVKMSLESVTNEKSLLKDEPKSKTDDASNLNLDLQAKNKLLNELVAEKKQLQAEFDEIKFKLNKLTNIRTDIDNLNEHLKDSDDDIAALQQHLDWHFRQNRRDNTSGAVTSSTNDESIGNESDLQILVPQISVVDAEDFEDKPIDSTAQLPVKIKKEPKDDGYDEDDGFEDIGTFEEATIIEDNSVDGYNAPVAIVATTPNPQPAPSTHQTTMITSMDGNAQLQGAAPTIGINKFKTNITNPKTLATEIIDEHYTSKIQIFVRIPNRQTLCIQINAYDTVEQLKISIETNAKIQCQRLVYGGRDLRNKDEISNYNIRPYATLDVMYRLMGGIETIKLFAVDWEGVTTKMDVDTNHTVSELKVALTRISTKYLENKQILMFNDVILQNHVKLAEYAIHDGTVIYIGRPNHIDITVMDSRGSRKIINTSINATLKDLRHQIQLRTNILPHQQMLYFNGMLLPNNSTSLATMGINDGAILVYHECIRPSVWDWLKSIPGNFFPLTLNGYNAPVAIVSTTPNPEPAPSTHQTQATTREKKNT